MICCRRTSTSASSAERGRNRAPKFSLHRSSIASRSPDSYLSANRIRFPTGTTWSSDAVRQARDGAPFFLRNHAPDIAAMAPTIGFDLLYACVIVRLDRRDLAWINVTANPTAEWIARQITEAFPWDNAPQHLIRDRDRITAPSSHADCAPWASGTSQLHRPRLGRMALPNGWSDRSGASVWTNFVVLGEAHLRRNLRAYAGYYNDIRTHRSLNKDAPLSRPIQRTGVIGSHAILGGLHRKPPAKLSITHIVGVFRWRCRRRCH